jgi:hypothetical protein
MKPTAVTRRQVEQELARARGARRMVPWAVASALGGGAIALVAGGGARGALAVAAAGLLFALFAWATSIARCPACGARLERKRPGPNETGPAVVEPFESCPRCRTRFA